MDLILYKPKSKNSRGNIQTHKLIKAYKKANKPFRLKSIIKVADMASYLDDRETFDKIILLGGDGTINQLTNQLIDHTLESDIYIKKNGSGNDYLRTLKNQDQNPQYIIRNTMDDNPPQYFINGTGIGLDGLVIDYVDNAKRKGKLTYFLSSFRAMVQFKPEPLDVTIDGEQLHFKKAYTLIVNNGCYVGGGMGMTKNARLDEESLDLLVIHTIPKLFLLFIFMTVYVGLHTKFTKYVYYRKCHHVKGRFTTPQFAQTDGEKFSNVTTVDIASSGKTIHYRAYK